MPRIADEQLPVRGHAGAGAQQPVDCPARAGQGVPGQRYVEHIGACVGKVGDAGHFVRVDVERACGALCIVATPLGDGEAGLHGYVEEDVVVLVLGDGGGSQRGALGVHGRGDDGLGKHGDGGGRGKAPGVFGQDLQPADGGGGLLKRWDAVLRLEVARGQRKKWHCRPPSHRPANPRPRAGILVLPPANYYPSWRIAQTNAGSCHGNAALFDGVYPRPAFFWRLILSAFYDFSAPRLDGTEQSLGDYRGKVILVVNVASHCGFTPQYAGLESLWRQYGERGLVVMGFPCNQFGEQEPGNADEIAQFCSLTYDVTFPLFAKVDVNGKNESPIWAWLKSVAPGILGIEAIKWNFTKFLLDRDGKVVERYAPTVEPKDIAADVERLL
ncbi:glutathione peroxidase [Youhaiella tibetensis]|uniref:Glutathione peroxidase n=1 Tax=Paradevosia tibetensis TaxID=1447062 RepID=A0A5B9DXF8_9HYPH|nr:glutathione peroxidase [Youhaiella tibetensis]